MNTTEEFLELYKQLEEVAVKRYGLPEDGKAVYYLEKRPEFRNVKTELGYCRDVRNLLQHKPKVENTFAVIPSEKMVELLRRTIHKINNPPIAKDIEIPISSVFFRSMTDFVRPAMVEMQRKVFTHIPILEDGRVVGVFSENTVFSYLIDEEIIGIDENMTFSDLKAYLPLDKHRSETFRFVKQNTTVEQVSIIFEQALKKQDRIGLMFTTRTGNADDPLLGIITAWDVAAR